MPASLPDTAAPTGASVTVSLVVDVSETGKALGAYQGRLVFAPSVISLEEVSQGEFEGVGVINADSAAQGVVRFTGASADALVNRGETAVLALTFTVLGLGGAVSPLDVELEEVTAAGDFRDLTGYLQVHDGSITADPGPVRMMVRSDSAELDPAGETVLRLWVDRRATVASPEAFEGRLLFDASVLHVDSVRAGTFGGDLSANLSDQANGIPWALANAGPPGGDSLVLVDFFARAVGSGGHSEIVLTMDEVLNGENLASLLPFLELDPFPGVRVRVIGGIWGDADFTWRDAPGTEPIAALDALICLSHVVGKDTDGYDVTACDVTADEEITAMDALVILSWVVGKDTSPFRVGTPR